MVVAVIGVFGDREGVMKVGDGGGVPRATCHGAGQEAVLVVN